jgi:protein-S-isoprenylcysteine O-methyltransferase Ste14
MSPQAKPTAGPPGVAACFRAIRAPELYRNFAVHLFIMFPAGMMLCLLATVIDAALGIDTLGLPALRIAAGAGLIGVGGLWVWYVYGYLFLVGHGSPGTHVDGGPTHLVDTGPYTMIRHPSVLGKVAAVAGLGVAWGSPTFLLGFLPVLIVYSVVTNRLLQERFCDERFGAAYPLYRSRVPMLIPRPSGVSRWLAGRPALTPAEHNTPHGHPPTISAEFRFYLGALAGLIALAGGVAWFLAG